MEKIRIRDGKNSDPGSATLETVKLNVYVPILFPYLCYEKWGVREEILSFRSYGELEEKMWIGAAK